MNSVVTPMAWADPAMALTSFSSSCEDIALLSFVGKVLEDWHDVAAHKHLQAAKHHAKPPQFRHHLPVCFCLMLFL